MKGVGNRATEHPRRAVLDVLLCAPALFFSRPARAGERVTAQTVGIDQSSPLFDPRNIGASKGVIWGGRERCDPTDVTCQQGGVAADGDVQPVPSTPSGFEITDRVRLSIGIAGEIAGDIELGLWRSAAPGSVDTFVKLARGVLISSPGDEPASYERSVALRVQRDKQVILGGLKQQGGQRLLLAGQTRPQRVPVAAPTNDDANALAHNAAGLVSVRRGGGSFEFALTTRAYRGRDREGLVIGQVTRGMELLERLNTLASATTTRTVLPHRRLRGTRPALRCDVDSHCVADK